MGCFPSKPTHPSAGMDDVDASAFDAPADSKGKSGWSAAPAPAASDEPEGGKELGAKVEVSEAAAEAIADAAHLRSTLGQKVGSPSFALPVLPFLNRECSRQCSCCRALAGRRHAQAQQERLGASATLSMLFYVTCSCP